jgi:hypothetical protein
MSYDPVKKREYYEKKKEEILNKRKEYYEKNTEKYKERSRKYYEENKETVKKNYEKNTEKYKERSRKYYEKNKGKRKEYDAKCYEERKQCAIDYITAREIFVRYEWDMWCDEIKRRATNNKHPYSDDFTNDVMFEMMMQACFYCGDIATTIDRIDSKLEHTPDNCVGSCKGCNISKNNADPSTFIKKSYYRVHEKYYDEDDEIWFVNKKKPSMCGYKISANKRGVPFELSKEGFDTLIKSDCTYCKRSPITWFGVDRVIPSKGYVLDNVASCCYDCNLDKLEDDVETMMARNKRIVDRVDACVLVVPKCDKVILRRGTC